MRVNIEDRAFGDYRRKKLSRLTGIPENHIFGPLACLWHGSQAQMRISGSKEEILDWCEEYDDELREILFDGLLRSKYITETNEGEYRIDGNQKQVEAAVKIKARSVKGGAGNKKRHSSPINEENASSDTRELEEKQSIATSSKHVELKLKSCRATSSEKKSPIQCNSMQGSTMQFNADKEKIDKKKDRGESDQAPSLSSADAEDVLSPKSKKVPLKWQEKISDFDEAMAGEWMTFAKETIPKGKFDEVQFQIAIAKMRENYSLDETKIRNILSWCQESEFWRNKSYSPVGLLKLKGEKANLDTILAQMSEKPKYHSTQEEDPFKDYKADLVAQAKEAQKKFAAEAEAEFAEKAPWELEGEVDLHAV